MREPHPVSTDSASSSLRRAPPRTTNPAAGRPSPTRAVPPQRFPVKGSVLGVLVGAATVVGAAIVVPSTSDTTSPASQVRSISPASRMITSVRPSTAAASLSVTSGPTLNIVKSTTAPEKSGLTNSTTYLPAGKLPNRYLPAASVVVVATKEPAAPSYTR